MVNLFGIKIDTSIMTLPEMENARDELQEALDRLNHEIKSRKIADHKHQKLNF